MACRRKRTWDNPEISWSAAHSRCHATWGRAAQYSCVDCDRQAQEWAYDGTDPDELYGRYSTTNTWMYFSMWPEFYMPLCKKCHRKRDTQKASIELREYRTWMKTTGLKLSDLPEEFTNPKGDNK